MRIFRVLCPLILFAVAAFAQRAMTAAQVIGFVKSSVTQKLDDRQTADVLRRAKLTEKLDASAVAELQALGTGPKTMAALKEMSEASASLPTAAPAPPPKPRAIASSAPPADVENIIGAIREYAINYTQNLPNFICTQVTRRQADQTGTGDHYQQMDKLQEQLTYYDHKESYKVVMVNNQMVTNQDHSKLGGAVSEGEFGSMMYEIFDPRTETQFEWHHLGKLDGRIMNVFSYRVTQPLSHYSIHHQPTDKTIIAGYHGLIYANRDNNTVMRITMECEDIPKDFPVQDLSIDMWYDVTKIAEQEYVLPLKWEMHSRDGHYLSWNSAEYTLYKKYGTESSIVFDTADSVPDSKTKEEPVAPPVKKKQ